MGGHDGGTPTLRMALGADRPRDLSPIDSAIAMVRYGLLLRIRRQDPGRLAIVVAITAAAWAAIGPLAAGVAATGLVAIVAHRIRQWTRLGRAAARSVAWDDTCDLYMRHGHVSANPGGPAGRVFAFHGIPDAPLCGPDFLTPGLVCMGCIDVLLDHPERIGAHPDADAHTMSLGGTVVPADPILMAALIADAIPED